MIQLNIDQTLWKKHLSMFERVRCEKCVVWWQFDSRTRSPITNWAKPGGTVHRSCVTHCSCPTEYVCRPMSMSMYWLMPSIVYRLHTNCELYQLNHRILQKTPYLYVQFYLYLRRHFFFNFYANGISYLRFTNVVSWTAVQTLSAKC